jgi:hypothetical protein
VRARATAARQRLLPCCAALVCDQGALTAGCAGCMPPRRRARRKQSRISGISAVEACGVRLSDGWTGKAARCLLDSGCTLEVAAFHCEMQRGAAVCERSCG